MYPLKTTVKYDPNNLAATTNTYTTVYLGNYVAGDFSEGHGSHLGVDIFPVVTHDDVFACLDGVVQVAENKAANGNYIIIKHDNVPDPADMMKKTTLYSCYLHLTEYLVTVGQLVSEGDVIGKCGNTGNVSGSTGEHLHFQMDRSEAPFHPYWPFSFAEAQTAGFGFFEAVNNGLGIENARRYTINPLVYLDQVEMHGNNENSSSGTPVVSSPVVSSVLVASIGNPISSGVSPMETPSVGSVPEVSHTEVSVGFSDVPSNHPYVTAINFLKSKGIVSGNDNKFSPDATITRAELLKMVFGAAETTLVTDSSNHFSDIDPTSWQAAYANTAKVNKIIGGYSDGTFRPNNPITRAEAFKIIINTFYTEALDTVSFPVFDDVSVDVWYAPYALFAKTESLINFSFNSFEPDTLMNRGEVANAIYMLLKR
ncbi:MAG: S-layer homology domain-containing protein [Candidatus Gracilibacteria bacterium]|nr:S-layer homology domain-containing protein [Candidatus Gracilibacteria bacterium]